MPAAVIAARAAKKTARSAQENPGAAVLVAVVGLVVVANVLTKASAPFEGIGEAAGDIAGDIAGKIQGAVNRAQDFITTDPFPAPNLNIGRTIEQGQAFLGGVFVGDGDEDIAIEQRYYEGVPVPTPQPIYQGSTDAGVAVRDFFGGIKDFFFGGELDTETLSVIPIEPDDFF